MTQNVERSITDDHVEIDHKAVGSKFKTARESRNITISDASSVTHIRQLYLKSIEDGNLDGLPGHIYKVGFVKTYASYLGLKPEEILLELNLNNELSPDYSSFTYSIPLEKQRRPGLKTTLAACTLLFFGGALLYISNQKTIHESDLAAESIVNVAPILPQPQLNEPEALSNSSQQVPTLVPDLELAPIQSQVQEDSAATSDQTATAQSSAVRILATKDSWVQVSDENGKAVFVRLMRSGESYTVPAEGNFKLNTGNGGGIKLLIGDQSTGALGEDGKVLRGIDLAKSSVESLLKK